ncbi:MAG TPA: ATP-dependent DNA helicase RecQ [Spirochaetaceae bacterium]|jgi:ATP-dependent DNA helicase RecQ|nr:ATP-dependent DNA helicase RecQ [Spirochaetaceae bacterium]
MEEEADPIARLALERFSIPYLYPYQRMAIANALDGMEACAHEAEEELPRGQIVILPTGYGKSLCFQLPALYGPGLTIVVYPLLGLMADQSRSLSARGIANVVVRGGMEKEELKRAYAALEPGESRIIVTNPEALGRPDTLKALAALQPRHLVVDEAHCVAEWGDSFRPAYLELGRLAKILAPRFLSAFTATASPAILSRLAELLFGDEPFRLVAGLPDRPNLHYAVKPALSMRQALRESLGVLPRPLIVFVPSRAGAELCAEELRYQFPSIESRFYHAGLLKEERAYIERWFFDSVDGVLCATCAYGMGIDKPNVRSVLHYGPPASIEAYVQESGRAGRDGKPAQALLLREAEAADYGAEKDSPTNGSLAEGRKRRMRDYGLLAQGCRRDFLLDALGVEDAGARSCGGCDLCDGTAYARAEGSEELRSLASRHARRFDSATARIFLLGEAHSGRWQASIAGSGSMSAWQTEEAEEALRRALELGILSCPRHGPWKDRLIPGRIGILD